MLENDKAYAADRVAKLQTLAEKHRESQGFQADVPAVAALAQARLLLATNYPDKALEELEILSTYARKFCRGQLLVTGHLLMACARADLLQPEQAQVHLLEALSLGHRLGLVRTFLDEGEVLRKMLAALASKPLGSEDEAYLGRLLERFGPANAGRSSESSTNGASSMLTPGSWRSCN
ncbi:MULTISPECIES: hypothetical protein [unclassified Pseudomonas]|uniref:hypothetical protein n=1 Tax=unclassified Pseudomonas TaxID=196821 RepID=UPI0021150943|nr:MULTISPECIES: hypothetical protein [unclassified Pseudomonas]